MTEREKPEYKRHPYKSEETDPIGALSSVPNGVLHVEDVRSFYHCKQEDLGVAIIYEQYRSLCNEQDRLKEQFISVVNKGFHHAINFIEDFYDKLVRFVLRSIHDQFMWLDRPHKITKEAIHVVTSFCSTGEVPLLMSIPKNDVENLTGSRWDKRAITMNDINDLAVKFSSMVIGYRISIQAE